MTTAKSKKAFEKYLKDKQLELGVDFNQGLPCAENAALFVGLKLGWNACASAFVEAMKIESFDIDSYEMRLGEIVLLSDILGWVSDE